MIYKDWEESVPPEITGDSVWNLKAYRAGLFLSELCWQDIQHIADKKYFSLADQPYRSTGSINANITEGYSRNSPKEKARFYEFPLGSARESKDWYFKSRHILGEKAALHRIKLLTSIIKLLLRMINEKRNSTKTSEPIIECHTSELDNLLFNAE